MQQGLLLQLGHVLPLMLRHQLTPCRTACRVTASCSHGAVGMAPTSR